MRAAPAIASLILLVTTLTTRADITVSGGKNVRKKMEPALSAPEPVPVKVSVRSGGTVEIPLQVFGATDVALAYQASSFPEFGKLSDPRMVGRATGVVTYQHSGEKTRDHDHFSYVSKRGRSVSAPVEVEISIIDDPPVLGVIDSLDFGTVTIGSTVTKEITIENRGGGKLKGSVAIDDPWKIAGPAAYNLRAGERQTFHLKFAPRSEEAYVAPLRYSSHPGQMTVVQAIAQSAIGVNPRRLELQPTQDATRTGVLTIVNRTDEAVPLRLHLGRGLSGAGDVTLPARGQISVTIATALGGVQAVDDAVRLDSPSFETSIPVHAPAAGPMIRALPASVSLGKIDSQRPVNATLQVTNSGGVGAQVRLETPPSVLVPPAESSFWLEAGATRNVNVSVNAGNDGAFRAVLQVKAPGFELQIPVVAEVASERRPNATAPTAVRVAEAIPIERTDESDHIPARQLKAEITRITATTCELQWPEVANAGAQYRLEGRSARMDEPWTPMSNAVITPPARARKISASALITHGVSLGEAEAANQEKADAANRAPAEPPMTARISQLSPGAAYEIRVVALDAAGADVSASFPLEFQTSAKFTLTGSLRLVVPASLLLGAFVLLQRGRRQARDSASESPATRETRPSPPGRKSPALDRARIIATRKGPAPVPKARASNHAEIFGTRETQPSSIDALITPPPANRRQVPFMREIEPGRHEIFFCDES